MCKTNFGSFDQYNLNYIDNACSGVYYACSDVYHASSNVYHESSGVYNECSGCVL